MVICIGIRKKEKQFNSTSAVNCCKCRYPQVKYCPTTYNHTWKQRQDSKAEKWLMTTQFYEQDYTHMYYTGIHIHG